MRRLLPLLLSFLILALSMDTSAEARRDDVPKLFCEHPRTLHLHRFEDHSATLECAGRVIARISVPG
jgi:hypothetical protein